MNPNLISNAQVLTTSAVASLKAGFDHVATWVTQLSWRKFLLFALLMIFAGGLINDTLFKSDNTVVVSKKKGGMHSKLFSSDKEHEITTEDGTSIRIDGTGLHITASPADATDAADRKVANAAKQAEASKRNRVGREAVPGVPAVSAVQAVPVIPLISAVPGRPGEAATPAVPGLTGVPAVPAIPAKARQPSDVHIYLPPEIGQEVREALADAVDEAASQEVTVARKKSSEWFMNFVLLLVAGLFGTKALMGGKKRAEALAQTANAAAERATLQREIAEAKMQVMQAQVEPHFLFNTLSSVEYLIETDPPRASAMQRSLIQYLRAVLPQMRDTAVATTLGREADMVRAYLDLLKMRMEERLTVDFRIAPGLRSAVFPPMMLQSLVENAIKHGLECKEQGGTLQVLAEVADNRLRVTVADDGLGFGAVASNGTGLGLQSIRDRLKLLYQDDAQLEIVPNQPTGVRSTIDVPYRVATSVAK